MCRVESPDTIEYPRTLDRQFQEQCDGSEGARFKVILLEAVTTPAQAAGAARVTQVAGRVLSEPAKGTIRKSGRVVLKLKLNRLGRQLLRTAPARQITVIQQTTISERSQPLRVLEKVVKLIRRRR